MDMLHISLFGAFHIHSNNGSIIDVGPRRCQELLSYLLLHRHQQQDREKVAALMWRDSTTAQAKRYLRQTLWQLQSAQQPSTAPIRDLLSVDHEFLGINPEAQYWLDVAVFEQAICAHHDTLGQALNTQQIEHLQAVLNLYKTGLLDDWDMEWCVVERECFRKIYLTTLEKLLVHSLIHRSYDEGINYGAKILFLDAAHERTHRRLMQLRYHSGDRIGAINQYLLCVKTLEDELGVPPSQKTTRLYQQICNDCVEPKKPEPEESENGSYLAELEQIQDTLSLLQERVSQMILHCQRDTAATVFRDHA
ncbi:MAG: BTAD domain-containing putative transcriptional regulator [Caldilineaceae bacterium]